MEKSKRLSIMYRIWANEIWKMITEYLSSSYSWSFFDPGKLVFIKIMEEQSRRVALSFGEHTKITLFFQVGNGLEMRFGLPMQMVLENLNIIKDFLETGIIPKEEYLVVLIKQFNETNLNYFEEELNYNVVVQK